MVPFYGWGSTESRRLGWGSTESRRLESLQGGNLLFTTKFTEIPGTLD